MSQPLFAHLLPPRFVGVGYVSLEYLSFWQVLLLFAALAIPIVLLGMRSLNGLGKTRKWTAIVIRLAVLLVAVLILGGLRWQRQHKDLEVMVLRDVSRSTELDTDYPGNKGIQDAVDDYLRSLMKDPSKKPDDRLGVVSFKEQALVDAMPDKELLLDTRAIREPPRGTDPSAAIELAMATMSADASHRFLLIWDGNQTSGDLDAAVAAAKAQHIPIDVMPLQYDVRNETLVERFVAPPLRRENEPFTLDVVLRSTSDEPVAGRLTVVHRIADGQDFLVKDRPVTLKPGLNVEHVHSPALHNAGVHQFHATFVPNKPTTNQVVVENPGATPVDPSNSPAEHQRPVISKEADAFTIVQGKGQVLFVDNFVDPETGARGPGQTLAKALEREGINLRTISVDQFPANPIDLQNYDAIILGNISHGTGGLDTAADVMLAHYVHDMGGGLVMIGGEEAFGAGGWSGTEVEKVLPVNMDIPAQRQVGKGALVLIMHSCEMPNGNYWGEQCAIKAVEALSDRDEIGVISYNWGGVANGGSQWDFSLQEKGDGQTVTAAIKNMKLGDMPSFDDSMNVALNGGNGHKGLKDSDARQKHVIIVSDGDPASPNGQLVAQYQAAKVSVSTVAVYPHPGQPPTMDGISQALHGRSYGPIESNPNQLPQIFIKEATVVRRSLINEDSKGIPLRLIDSSDDFVKGIAALPPVTGMVLTSKKNDPKVVMPVAAGKMNDPVLVHWQSGLGKSAVFTSDAFNKWSAAWVGSDVYDKLWAQVVRGVSRAPLSSDFEVQTTLDGEKGHVKIEAFNKDASSLNFLSMAGTVIGGADMKERPLHIVQTGPGTYEGDFATNGPGNYVVAAHYSGQKGEQGMLINGAAMNTDPELRQLRSNDARLYEIAESTGGRALNPWDAKTADIFSRAGVQIGASPMPIWDRLLMLLLAMILLDVATRRIAWDRAAIRRATASAAQRVRDFTTVRRVETRGTLEAFKRVREETSEAKSAGKAGGAPAPPVPRASAPDPKAKFEAPRGVEGDISKVVGGATDKPLPSAPKKIEPKGGPGGYTSSLLEAKRRAQEEIRKKQKGEDGNG